MERLSPQILLLGLGIFAARVLDVSMGTVRTIATVQGRTWTAFLLGLIEITIWILVAAAVIREVGETPVLGVFYALGFATGNVVGIKIERRLAFGHNILRVITRKDGQVLAAALRTAGHVITTFQGEGRDGPVTELYIVCRRRDCTNVLGLVRDIDPDAFYITEPAGSVSKVIRPIMQQATGWRATLKKK